MWDFIRDFIIIISLGSFRLKFVYFNRFVLILIYFNCISGIHMGNIVLGLMSGNFFQVFGCLIDMWFHSKSLWKLTLHILKVHCCKKHIAYFDQKWQTNDNFFEWWSPDGPQRSQTPITSCGRSPKPITI